MRRSKCASQQQVAPWPDAGIGMARYRYWHGPIQASAWPDTGIGMARYRYRHGPIQASAWPNAGIGTARYRYRHGPIQGTRIERLTEGSIEHEMEPFGAAPIAVLNTSVTRCAHTSLTQDKADSTLGSQSRYEVRSAKQRVYFQARTKRNWV